jgi:hypothetical protein
MVKFQKRNKMDIPTLKIYLFNGIALVISFTEIDLLLKAFLTIIVGAYTLYKWHVMYQDRNKPKDKKD